MLRNVFLALALVALLVFSGCIDGGTGNGDALIEPDYLNNGNAGQDGVFGNDVLPDENFPVNANGQPGQSGNAPLPELQLELFNGGFFSIEKPVGWEIFTAGSCATFSFLIRDPQRHERQVFYYGEVGPVYLCEEQKGVDLAYMNMGGYPVLWYEMPVIDPLTAENFLQKFHLIAGTGISNNFLPQAPKMEGVEIISSSPGQSLIAGDTKNMRALFQQENSLAEGQFFVTVSELLPCSAMPDSGIGYGFSFTGISAEQAQFKQLEAQLAKSIESLFISEDYVKNCLQQQDQQAQGILRAGKTLSSISDDMMASWENRNRSDDIISEKRSDAILGYERVFDQDTGEVYRVQNGFYDSYNINRQAFEMSNLQQLPENSWNLWTAATSDETYIR